MSNFYHPNFIELVMLLNDGKDIWVKFNNPQETRCGTIGLVRHNKLTPLQAAKIAEQRKFNKIWYNGYADCEAHGNGGIVVEFPGLPNKPMTVGRQYKWEFLEILKNYSGPAVRASTEVKARPLAEFTDKFGVKAQVGDFITFIGHERLQFGTITKFTTSQLFYRTLDKSESYFVTAEFAIIDKDFRKRMMLKKLSGDI